MRLQWIHPVLDILESIKMEQGRRRAMTALLFSFSDAFRGDGLQKSQGRGRRKQTGC